MASRIANESEHRRGLVLGFTLAEVMILLLFLILLGFGARLLKEEKTLKELTPLLTQEGVVDVHKFAAELARMKEQEKAVSELQAENTKIRAELSTATHKLETFERLAAAARAVNPEDPPALLKLSLDVLEVMGLKIDQAYWTFLSEVSAMVDKAVRSKDATEREAFRQGVVTFIRTGGGIAPGHTWPPIIRLREADGYSFSVGSAELKNEFEKLIVTKVIPQIVEISRQFEVDVIEVVGHTDEQTIAPRPSNLDKELLPVLRGEKEIKTLIPADNVGLGLTRAIAIVEVLRRDRSLINYRILPLSGAQLIQTDESLSSGSAKANVPERRRIEIRLRKSNQLTVVTP
jgi:flagellar motor protein MotB